MENYGYVAPRTVKETLSILGDCAVKGERAQILAGGTDLIVQMRTTDKAPRLLVDIKHLVETTAVEFNESDVYTGAAVPCGVLYENQKLKDLFPGLLESADLIGSTQIQGRASIGGNLCNSSPAADTVPALFVNGAVCVIATPSGAIKVPVERFVTGVGRNCLESDQFLLGFRLPRPRPRTADGYLRFIPRTEMDIAVASAGVSLTLDEEGTCTHAKVSIGAVAPTVLDVPAAAHALIGTKLDDHSMKLAADECSNAASPINDKRGTITYRKKVVGVLCRRAAQRAYERVSSRDRKR